MYDIVLSTFTILLTTILYRYWNIESYVIVDFVTYK